MYVRTLFTIVVSLVTTRIVLQVLGADDYGIYGVVGGIVLMLEFLNKAMSGATSRFLTFEMGRGDGARLSETFNASMATHIVIALTILVLAETVGLWFLETRLNIPETRMTAARWVYQLSIVTAMMTVVQSPYNASIIAHENMDVYAFVEIGKSVLMLIAVLSLTIWPGTADLLIVYAALFCCVVTLIMLSYRFYCVRHYDECRFRWSFRRATLMPMLKFSALDLYGNGCVSVRQQGVNFLINIFFKVTYNATATIATMVTGALQGLTYAVIQAFRPQIIKQYAIGDLRQMQRLMCNACLYSILLMACMATPVILEMPTILDIWLSDTIPPQAVMFCRLLVIASLWGVINTIINTGIHATGRITTLSIIGGTLLLFNLPVVGLLYHFHFAAYHAYTTLIVTNIVMVICGLTILKHQMPEFNWRAYIRSVLRGLAATLVAATASYGVMRLMTPSIWRVLVVGIVNFLVLAVIMWTLLLDASARSAIKNAIKR